MSDTLEDRVKRLEQQSAMYGPIRLGGPCPKCGLTQFEHHGLGCEAAKKYRADRLSESLGPIIKASIKLAKGESHG